MFYTSRVHRPDDPGPQFRAGRRTFGTRTKETRARTEIVEAVVEHLARRENHVVVGSSWAWLKPHPISRRHTMPVWREAIARP